MMKHLLFLALLFPSHLFATEASDLLRKLEARKGMEVESVSLLRFNSNKEGWKATGVQVRQGQGVTLFAFGQASEQLWIRLGDSDVMNVGGAMFPFVAWETAELELLVRPRLVRWQTCDGELPPAFASAPAEVLDLELVAVTWSADLEDSLAALSENQHVAAALEDLREFPTLPPGFRPVCHLGYSRVFHAYDDGERRGIRGLARNSAGIVKKAIDLPLLDDSEISFEWLWRSVPALGPENEASSHDYSSIAVEFDNGQDITWIRSRHLDAGTHFRCPLEWWDGRETHIVLQDGEKGLGTWESHRLNLAQEYDRAVGGKRPQRIVGIWFISVGAFGQTSPDTIYANVVLRSGEKEVVVFE